MRTKKATEEVINEQIVPEDMSTILTGAFNRYAKAVISDRAIPDVRDGLKPVQRRIIYGMAKKGWTSSKEPTKCATIYGEIMGHYHPHGDASIYDAMAHLSQSWKMGIPLLIFQGNNGSIDGDSPAAPRYTEARLSPIADYLVKDIDKDIVDMVPTFDDKQLEPTVLPARFPNLLVNGTSGIAVGSTTYIPPHNLTEVIDAICYRIGHKRATLDDLLGFIKGPDLPTGGIIDDKEALRKLYESGSGSITIYSKAEINREENSIHITNIPYGTLKIMLVKDLVSCKETNNLDNIEEILDLSSKGNIDIVIQVKKGASPDDVLNYLQNKNKLSSRISCNFLALDHGHPKTMSLLDMIDAFIDFQREIETRTLKYDLGAALDRKEIVEGLVKAYPIVDEIIEKIKKCSGKEGVKRMLQDDYAFTERQAEAIAMMPLYRLSRPDIEALRQELDDLNKKIARIKELLSDSDKLDRYIVSSLKDISKRFGTPRKTEILDERLTFDTISQTQLIAKEDCYVSITADGYAKRSSVKSYVSSKDARPDDPLNIPKTKAGDRFVFMQKCSTHDFLLFFTDKGNYCYLPVHMLTDVKWKEEGKHLNNILSLKSNEKIVRCLVVNDFREGINVAILTALNKIKRIPLSELRPSGFTKKPLKACKLLNDDDQVVSVELTTGNSDLIVMDNLGRASRFNENEVPIVGTSAIGVKAIASSVDNAPLVSMISLAPTEATLLLILAKKGAARLIYSSDIETTSRLGPKTSLIRILKRNPQIITSLLKVEKIRGQKNYALICTNESSIALDLGDLSPIALNSEMRLNIPEVTRNNQRVVGVHCDGFVLDDSFKVYTPKEVRSTTAKASPDKADTQLSLFDIFAKESGDK